MHPTTIKTAFVVEHSNSIIARVDEVVARLEELGHPALVVEWKAADYERRLNFILRMLTRHQEPWEYGVPLVLWEIGRNPNGAGVSGIWYVCDINEDDEIINEELLVNQKKHMQYREVIEDIQDMFMQKELTL